MRTHMKRVLSDERGLTTAEYAVGTVAVVGLGGVLAKLLASDQVRDLVWSIMRAAFSSFLG
jgi:hypothetical protein